jgi:integrase/recombinase XerD
MTEPLQIAGPSAPHAASSAAPVAAALNRQTQSDGQVLALWLHGRNANTQAAYRLEAGRFIDSTRKALQDTTLADVQTFADSLSHLAPASRARALAAVKSFFAFAHRLGYLPFDVTRPVRLPAQRSRLAERILSEPETQRLLALESNPRNRVLLRLLYAAGVRVSELTGLCWRDLAEREDSGQITVFGKGEKTRAILLPASIWRELVALRGTTASDTPVFPSRSGGGRLSRVQVERIVTAAARRAGIEGKVSPHWLRHAHASHALDRGAPIHLVQATLGHASVATTGRYLHARPTESSSRYLAV